jgi:hypothetical protein
MKNKANIGVVIWLVIFVLAAPMDLMAQTEEQGSGPGQSKYTQEQLDQLLAPIALYPDSLLSQILMASTYPLEVVEADRWLKQNSDLTGDSLDAALKDKQWDVSVKSLCHFPGVIAMMSDKLEDTADLGNAFLDQQDQVMDSIQNLRAKARAQGHLESTDKQKVIAEDPYITIEPAEPDVIYVPAYDPCWVYGPWWYPLCSPPWFWYPDLVVGVGFWFGPGIFIGPLDGWCGFHWHHHRIFVNVNKTFAVGRVGITRMHGGFEVWRHNPVHRRGVAYRNSATGRWFGQTPRPGGESRRAFRGFPHAGSALGQQVKPEIGRRAEHFGPAAPRFQQPRRGNAFKDFGRSGNEVKQHSARGFESMGRENRTDGRIGGGREGGSFHGMGSHGGRGSNWNR